MRTCLALWTNMLVDCLSQGTSQVCDDLIRSFRDNHVVNIFDGSNQYHKFLAKFNPTGVPSDISIYDYEAMLAKALITATGSSLEQQNSLPISELQFNILSKLRLRNLTVNFSDELFWSSTSILYSYYVHLLDREEIERVIFSEYPHTIYDYLFYLACFNKCIPCFSVQFIGQLGRTFSYIIDMTINTILPNNHNIIGNRDCFSDFLGLYSDSLTSYSSSIQSLYETSRHQTRIESLELARQGDNGFLVWTNKQVQALRAYNSLTSKDFQPAKKEFGVFFLQVEPESTVTPLSGYFSNQTYAVGDFYDICLNSSCVPCVKEHPHQYKGLYPYSSNAHWQSNSSITASKSSEFYLLLKEKYPKLIFLPINVSPGYLMSCPSYCLTGTLNGTVGLQSIFVEKKIVEYGLAWYSCHPLVTSRRYNERTNCVESIDSVHNPIIDTIELELSNNPAAFVANIVAAVDSASIYVIR